MKQSSLAMAYDQSKGYLHTAYDKVTGLAQDASQQAQDQARQAYERTAGAAQAGQDQAGQARGRVQVGGLQLLHCGGVILAGGFDRLAGGRARVAMHW